MGISFYIYPDCSIRSAANGLASHGSDVDLCISGPILDKIISESESEATLHSRIGKFISQIGRILGGRCKYFIKFNRVST
jgi:hypothetical protein